MTKIPFWNQSIPFLNIYVLILRNGYLGPYNSLWKSPGISGINRNKSRNIWPTKTGIFTPCLRAPPPPAWKGIGRFWPPRTPLWRCSGSTARCGGGWRGSRGCRRRTSSSCPKPIPPSRGPTSRWPPAWPSACGSRCPSRPLLTPPLCPVAVCLTTGPGHMGVASTASQSTPVAPAQGQQ